MSKSKAVSSELNNLFSKIEKQADEYEKAFEDLNVFFREADRTRRAVEELLDRGNILYAKNLELYEKFDKIEQYINLRLAGILDEMKKMFDTVIAKDFKIKADETFNSFEKRAEDTLGLIAGKESVIELIDRIKEFAKEADEKLLELDNKLLALDSRIIELKSKNIEIDEVKKEYDEMKIELTNKIADIENNMENKIIGYFSKTSEKYNSMFEKLIFNSDERIKNAIIDIKETQISINQKVRTTEEKMNSFMMLSNELFKHIKELKEKTHSKK